MLKRRLGLKIILIRGMRNIVLAPTLSRKISRARTNETGNNSLSMPKQQLPLRRRRKTSLRCLVSHVVNLFILLRIVLSVQTVKRKRSTS
jgi:hypothetical protein